MSNNTALLIIDVQLGMFDESDPVFQGDKLLSTIGELIGRAREAGVPVVYVQHDGTEGHPLEPDSPGWPIHPGIAPVEGELVIHKQDPDSFQETALQDELQKREIGHLVIAGIQTEYCVDTTCRRAYSLGYDVTLVQDGHSTWNAGGLTASQIIAHHNNTLGGWFAALQPAQAVVFGGS